MKFESKERKLTSSHKTMSVELGLADQKKAIELLYSQYSKPIQTCVQELVSNAFDAMQDANRSHVPIKITLPNELNDFYFSVRDFGNSMDEDTIKNVYMRVNASTKSSNNKAIGGFGIGSKTPWAYTDTFILKTFLNGLETQYALVKGRSSVSIVYQGKTDQENGTEVIFKTKERDKDSFLKAVRRISLCARTKPIVNTKESLDFDTKDILSPSVMLVKSDLLNDYYTYLNIGGVLYKLNESFFHNNDTPWRAETNKERLENYLESSLIINVPVGAVMPLQTREGLFTGGEEGQQNKAVVKKLVNHALKVVESTLEAREKQVIDVSSAVSFFSSGMLSSKKRFTFGNIEVSSSGFNFKGVNSVSHLSRSKSRGWGKAVKAKKTEHNFLTFKELGKYPIFFSELSPNKARLTNRLHRICASTDVIVLEQHLFEDSKVYQFLKSHTNARNIEELEVTKTSSKSKGVKRDMSKVVTYDYYGNRLWTINLSREINDDYVVLAKDSRLNYNYKIFSALGYKVISVAPSNVKKLLEHESGKFTTPEKALDLEKVAKLYSNFKARRAFIDLGRVENLDYIKNLANPNKQILFKNVESVNSNIFCMKLIEMVKEKHGKSIDRAVKQMVKHRARAIALANKAPLAQHVKYPSSLKGQAKKDLDAYIVKNIGEWYGTHQIGGRA